MFHQSTSESVHNLQQRETLVPTVDVPTSTCILHDREDPHLVLVGLSHKHGKPVLPGGKIDMGDLCGTDLSKAARSCIIREILEETGCHIADVELLEVISHGDADVRAVAASSLDDTLVSSKVAEVPSDTVVTARYGNPDYIFVGRISIKDVAPSAELYQLGFIDIRSVPSDALGAGHSAIIESYRRHLACNTKSFISNAGHCF